MPGRIERLLFPVHCRLCGLRVRSSPALCDGCRRDLPWLATTCGQCGQPLPQDCVTKLCGRCLKHPPPFDATTAVLHYHPPADFLVQRLKFSGELALAPLLAGLLADRLAVRKAALPRCLLPVPLHRSRLRERGFNQATELARHLGRRLGIPVDYRLCRRHRPTEPQSLLPVRQRRGNLRNAFTVTAGVPAAHVAIIDDVMTSGHTAGELARALKRSGAERIEVWVIARAGH